MLTPSSSFLLEENTEIYLIFLICEIWKSWIFILIHRDFKVSHTLVFTSVLYRVINSTHGSYPVFAIHRDDFFFALCNKKKTWRLKLFITANVSYLSARIYDWWGATGTDRNLTSGLHITKSFQMPKRTTDCRRTYFEVTDISRLVNV